MTSNNETYTAEQTLAAIACLGSMNLPLLLSKEGLLMLKLIVHAREREGFARTSADLEDPEVIQIAEAMQNNLRSFIQRSFDNIAEEDNRG